MSLFQSPWGLFFFQVFTNSFDFSRFFDFSPRLVCFARSFVSQINKLFRSVCFRYQNRIPLVTPSVEKLPRRNTLATASLSTCYEKTKKKHKIKKPVKNQNERPIQKLLGRVESSFDFDSTLKITVSDFTFYWTRSLFLEVLE